eukprot:scaffold22452_cov67-Isochrysis_galbana.AAC.1
MAHRPSPSHSPTPAPAASRAATHSGDGAAAASISAVAPRRSRAPSRPAGPVIPGPAILGAVPPTLVGADRSSARVSSRP